MKLIMSMSAFETKPDYIVPPGRYLAEHLDVFHISKSDLSSRSGVSVDVINGILSGKSAIKPETAVAFEMVLGVPAKLWLGLENSYQLQLVHNKKLSWAGKVKSWVNQFPIDELVKFGFIKKTNNKSETVLSLLRFFGVESIDAWKCRYNNTSVAYLRSEGELSKASAATWLRIAELEIKEQDIFDYDHEAFHDVLSEIRKLIVKPFDKAWPKIISLCNGVGVGISLTESLSNEAFLGAAWWYSPKIAVIQINPNHLMDDKFWFIFFHEAAHILLHEKRIKNLKSVYIDMESDIVNDRESQANEFASNLLISKEKWVEFTAKFDGSKKAVVEFSKKQKVVTGVVLGLLGRENIEVNFNSEALIRKLNLSTSK